MRLPQKPVNRFHLDPRGRLRHYDERRDVQLRCCIRYTLGVIPGGRRYDPPLSHVFGKACDLVTGPAQLEGEDRLTIFTLEQNEVSETPGEHACGIQWRFLGDIVNARITDSRDVILEHW